MNLKTLTYLFLLLSVFAFGQNTNKYEGQVIALQKKYDSLWDSSKETTVFAGSSTIRMWKNLESMFPNHQIVNSGFGGSQTSDLYHYNNELILRYSPKKVFIYEGDNDIAAQKKIRDIIGNTQKIIEKVKEQNQEAEIVIIAAKPSIARWNLKRKYKKLNRRFKRLCKKENNLEYANVWDAMLDGRKVRQDIFIEDGLHMNNEGYDLWYSVIKPHMD